MKRLLSYLTLAVALALCLAPAAQACPGGSAFRSASYSNFSNYHHAFVTRTFLIVQPSVQVTQQTTTVTQAVQPALLPQALLPQAQSQTTTTQTTTTSNASSYGATSYQTAQAFVFDAVDPYFNFFNFRHYFSQAHIDAFRAHGFFRGQGVPVVRGAHGFRGVNVNIGRGFRFKK